VNTDHPEDEKTVPGPPEGDDSSPESDSVQPQAAGDEPAAAPRGEPDPPRLEGQNEKLLPGAPPEPDRKSSFTSLLAFFFALIALVGTAWMWWQEQQGVDQAESRAISEFARLEGADSELDLKIRQLQERVEGLPTSDSSSEIAALETRLRADAVARGCRRIRASEPGCQ
jgi:hypothetical protein